MKTMKVSNQSCSTIVKQALRRFHHFFPLPWLMSTFRKGQRFTQSEREETGGETLATYVAARHPANAAFNMRLVYICSFSSCLPAFSSCTDFHRRHFLILHVFLKGPTAGFCKAATDNLSFFDRHNVNSMEGVHTVCEAGLWLQGFWLLLFLLYYFRLGGLVVGRAAH